MRLANKATHILTFQVEAPAVGYSVYAVKTAREEQCLGAGGTTSGTVCATPAQREEAGTVIAESDMYAIQIDNSTGLVSAITNKASGISTSFAYLP